MLAASPAMSGPCRSTWVRDLQRREAVTTSATCNPDCYDVSHRSGIAPKTTVAGILHPSRLRRSGFGPLRGMALPPVQIEDEMLAQMEGM